MLASVLRLAPAPGGGRPVCCPAVACSRRLGYPVSARSLLAPIAAGKGSAIAPSRSARPSVSCSWTCRTYFAAHCSHRGASEEWERWQDAVDAAERRWQRRARKRQVGKRSSTDEPDASSTSDSSTSSRQRGSSLSRHRRIRHGDSQRSGTQNPLTPLVDAVKGCRSCGAVWRFVQREGRRAEGNGGLHVFVLSSALDGMKKKAACEGGSEADRQAVMQLLQLATERLSEFTPWALAAFIRCAAAFKGLMQPEQLAAWQAAALQHADLWAASAQDVSNMLLSLGTLAESDERLAAEVSQPLAEQLLQHVTELAAAGKLAKLQDAANCLYGAALLGLQPTAAQTAALFGAVQRALERRQYDCQVYINATQTLLACAKLSDVQPEPGAAPTPGEDPFLRFYPGAGLVDALLRIATSGNLPARNASQLVGACGTLLHMPWQQEGTALLAAMREHADDMNAINASAFLVGCARLGAPPGPAAIEACVAAVEREGPSCSWAASNIAWALAVLEACDLRTWQRLTTVVASDVASLVYAALIQWAQAHQLMQLRHGHAVPCPPELLQRSQAAWEADLQREQQQQQGKAASRFERLLAAAVADLAGGRSVQSAHIATGSSGEPLALVDVALPQLRIAVEADGPYHFLRNRQGSDGQPLPNGPTSARDRLLAGHGWRVVAVPFVGYSMFADAGATDAKAQGVLRRYLEERTGLAALIAKQGPAT